MHRHGDGNYWGTPFLTGAVKTPVDKDRWICVEMMLKMNSLENDLSDGEQAFWIDGKLCRAADQIVSYVGPGFPRGRWTGGWWQPDPASPAAFEGFRWCSTHELKINYIWAYLYITKARPGHVSKVWFDNIVVARQYIGPVATSTDKDAARDDASAKGGTVRGGS